MGTIESPGVKRGRKSQDRAWAQAPRYRAHTLTTLHVCRVMGTGTVISQIGW